MPSQKARKGYDRASAASTSSAVARGRASAGISRNLIGLVLLVAVVAVGGLALLLANGGKGGNETVIQAQGGSWTNIAPDTLASKLKTKDFTLLNVKTPYIGEIDGTDLYIPYTDLAARASELPANKAAAIVVYCRSGHESAIAAQTLLDLGYTNIDNLDGGMTAWTASGRSLVQLPRS